MKSKDIFNLAVRVLGLVFLYQGLSAIGTFFEIVHLGGLGQSRLVVTNIIAVAWPLAVAYWLLRGAPLLMRIAYPGADKHSESEHQIFGASEKKADA